MFDGLMNMDDTRVCIQVRPDIKHKIRGIQAGDVLGSLFSVVEVGYESMGNGVGGWMSNELKEKVKLMPRLEEVRREQVLNMLWERRGALSQGDEDLEASKLPEFKIVLTDDTPIYQRPHHFPPPVAREIEELERIGVLEE